MSLVISVRNEKDFESAVDFFNESGVGGTIEIDGTLVLTKNYIFNQAVSLIGKTREAKIETQINTPLFWSGGADIEQWNFTQVGSRPGNPSAINGFFIKLETTKEETLSPGDYYYIRGTEIPTSVLEPHPNSRQFGALINCIDFVSDDGLYLKPVTPNPDTYCSNGTLIKINPLKGITVKDLTFEYTGDLASYSNYQRAMFFNKVADVIVENVRFLRQGPGAIVFNFAFNCKVVKTTIDGIANDDKLVYGIVAQIVNGLIVDNCMITGTRHAFTTGPGITEGNIRYGTPLNCLVQNSIINCQGKGDGNTRIALDTHAEGYGVTFKNCTVNMTDAVPNVGFNLRSRNCVVDSCTFSGNLGATKMGLITGVGARIINCSFFGAWYGIDIYSSYSSVINCLFGYFFAGPVRFNGEDGYLPSSQKTATLYSTSSGFALTSHGFSNGDLVYIAGKPSLPAGLTTGNYYVVNASGNSFKLSTSPDGEPVSFSAGVLQCYVYKVASPQYGIVKGCSYTFMNQRPAYLKNNEGWELNGSLVIQTGNARYNFWDASDFDTNGAF